MKVIRVSLQSALASLYIIETTSITSQNILPEISKERYSYVMANYYDMNIFLHLYFLLLGPKLKST